ncbi:MAG TPA: thioredoxin family protein [Stenotrophomonas sp.]|nr:thioredoxin family protein [Stenotrophomonas sp.]
MNANVVDIRPPPHIVDRDAWLRARMQLLAREKALTRLQDEVSQARRGLPWVRVDTPYLFDTLDGPRSLAELFGECSQLMVQHFMFAPGWEQGCKSCSFMADHNDGALAHLAQRDLAFVAIARAPLPTLEAFRQRMGWKFRFVSSNRNSFNHDFGVAFTQDEMSSGGVDYNYTRQPFPHQEAPGISVFARDAHGQVFHTYSRFGRGVEVMMHTYALLELTPRGRDEDLLAYPMAWVRHHDRYETA